MPSVPPPSSSHSPSTTHSAPVLQAFLNSTSSTPPSLHAVADSISSHTLNCLVHNSLPSSLAKLCQSALSKLCKFPNPAIIDPFLRITPHPIPLDNVDGFVLSSTIWKFLVFTLTKLPAPTSSCIYLLIPTALNACSQLLLNLPDPPTRGLKLARFHTLNASRIAAILVKHPPANPIDLVKPIHQTLLTIAVCQWLLYPCHPAPQAIFQELQQGILPNVMQTFNALIDSVVMAQADCNVMSKAIKFIREDESKLRGRDHGSVVPVKWLLAILRIIQESAKREAPRIAFYQAHFLPVILPALFRAVSSCPGLALGFPPRYDNSLPETIATGLGSCVSYMEWTAEKLNHVEDALLTKVGGRNPVSAMIAGRSVIHMAADERYRLRRKSLLSKVLSCSRLANTLRTGQLVTRWVPLSAGIAMTSGDGQVLREALLHFSLQGMDQRTLNAHMFQDPVIVHVLAEIGECTMSRRKEKDQANGEHPQAVTNSNIESLIHDLLGTKVNPITYIENLLSLEHCASETKAANIRLLHQLVSEKEVSRIAQSCLKSCWTSAEHLSYVYKALYPATMTTSNLADVLKSMWTAVQRYDVEICPSIAEFTSRAAHCIGDSIPEPHWRELCKLLRAVMQKGLHHQGNCRRIVLNDAIFHHASVVFKVATEISQTRLRVHIAELFPKDLYDLLEQKNSQAVEQQRRARSMTQDQAIELERRMLNEAQKSKGGCQIGSAASKDSFENEIDRVQRELVGLGKKCLIATSSVESRIGLMRRLGSDLRQMAMVIEGVADHRDITDLARDKG